CRILIEVNSCARSSRIASTRRRLHFINTRFAFYLDFTDRRQFETVRSRLAHQTDAHQPRRSAESFPHILFAHSPVGELQDTLAAFGGVNLTVIVRMTDRLRAFAPAGDALQDRPKGPGFARETAPNVQRSRAGAEPMALTAERRPSDASRSIPLFC